MHAFDKYVGQVFDNRYKIMKILGVGGMAVVFEAFDTAMKRVVAIKMLKDEIANDSQSVKRFINESKAVSMLSHPNIVSIYDVSVKDNLKYIVMERVDGITLKSYMTQKGALTIREAISITEQILKALEHAHSKGIIHRDIKPHNIMLIKSGRIKVTDFGIAKLPNAETVTMTDKAIGTVFYISPEQASGKPIDPRSDLYSLGVMMYEMVTGVLPFNADSPVSVALMQVNTQPKPPREIMPTIPQGFEQIILMAMEKQPEKRFQNAAQMLRHVTQIKVNPTYVFKPKKAAEAGNENAGKNGKELGKKKFTMFPVILGVTTAFLLIAGISVGLIFSKFNTKKSGDPVTVEIPKLIQEKFDDKLKDKLIDQGYRITVKYESSNEYEKNTILEQSPKPGEKRKVILGKQYCDLTITLSQGENAIVLPDLTVKEYREAESQLNKLGLLCVEEHAYNDNIPLGYVIKTSPAAGEKVNPGDSITIYISKGQELTYVLVPDLSGLTLDQAKDQLIEYQLGLGDVIYEQSDKPAGTVIYQSRPPFESVPANTTSIDLTVSLGR